MKLRKKEISSKKVQAVKELSGLMKGKRTLLVASIKNIPASQFQEISKKFRDRAVIKVPKKNLINRVIDIDGSEGSKEVKDNIQDSVAIIFSDLDPFDLAADLLNNKTPAKAKPGQIAPEDIEVQAGPTDLVPGPAISELGALGIQIQIEKGKIHIKTAKIIAKAGEPISKGAAEIMSKLDIKPFKIGFIPLSAYDSKDQKFYSEISIDREGTLESLKDRYTKALAFAIQMNYTSEDTVRFLIGKAAVQSKRINRIVTGEPEEVVVAAPVEVKEEKKEEPKEEVDVGAGFGALF